MKMEVIKGLKGASQRQIAETIEIKHSIQDILMNIKGDYNDGRIPRVTIEVEDYQQDDWEGTEWEDQSKANKQRNRTEKRKGE